ncbi:MULTISPECIES: hypothetical protein [Streptomyces]|uniref:hypothetical protein n=1 Tax=Streptomyces TaxID=1883 RepID=UPI001F303173|nr:MULTISPECIES: hypothetical protein [Streptomyces]
MANLRVQVNMPHRTVHFIKSLLQRLLPSQGRHRAGATRHLQAAGPAPTSRRPANHALVLRGEDVALVRPYLIAYEQQEEERLQRQRRRALWLAVNGIDVGPYWIHGVQVTP